MVMLPEQTRTLCWAISVVLILRWLHISKTTDFVDGAPEVVPDPDSARAE